MTAEALERSLRAAVADAGSEATRSGRPQWAALRARVAPRDGLEIFDGAGEEERFYWERPDEGWSLAALGAAQVVEASGADRFRAATRASREIFSAIHLAGEPGPRRTGALLVGGFAFSETPSASPSPAASPIWSGFPPCRLVLPELLFAREGDRMWCTVVRRIDPGADVERESRAMLTRLRERSGEPYRTLSAAERCAPAPTGERQAPSYVASADRTHAEYRARVDAALRDIAAGDLEKVVVARSIDLRHNAPLDPGALLDDLRAIYPTCTSFAVGRPGGVFLGATPEHLVRLENTRVETAAVAGSAPRGRNPEDDARLGRELCESKKEQAEHAVVVRALREALDDCCEALDVPEAPRLQRLGEIQHLETPITGTLRNGQSILELVERLHPTPAVGGAPRAAALAWIARREDLDRGWYAGPVGFVDADGGGDFCVALRSALLRGSEARLFAGAGIVDGSIPDAELQETRLKLRGMLASLLEI
jgi:isochorismate synthase